MLVTFKQTGSCTEKEKTRCFALYSESKQALADQLELKRPAVLAVSGVHGSGKTTLLEKLLPILRGRGLRWGSSNTTAAILPRMRPAPMAAGCGRPGPRAWPCTPGSATC